MRDYRVYMNHPLRVEGKTFYQASFGDDDKLSVLQVVDNISWLFPYISCGLMSIGLCLHFTVMLVGFLKNKNG